MVKIWLTPPCRGEGSASIVAIEIRFVFVICALMRRKDIHSRYHTPWGLIMRPFALAVVVVAVWRLATWRFAGG